MRITYLIFLFTLLLCMRCSSPQPETPNSKPETTSSNNEYYENGNIRIEKKRLENGDSLWIFKQEDGGCWEENFYRDGEIYKKIVYNSDCTKSAEYELKNGKRHGYWKSYHENGKLREEGNYEKGIENGIFKYYSQQSELLKTEYNFILDSLNIPCFNFENNYKNFIEYLDKNNRHYEIKEDIKVAGNNEYHFPIIESGLSSLYFEHKEGKSIIKCFKGELHDCEFVIFDKICPDNADGGLLSITGIEWKKEMEYIRIFDLSEKRMYYFYLSKDQLTSVRFEPIEVRN
jgi:hypothetical protein